MREAKLAAGVIGVLSVCLIGGGVVAYNAAPQVSTRDNFEIVEPAYNDVTLTAETSDENKTAITKTAKEKKGNKNSVSESNKSESTVNLSYIVSSTDNTSVASTIVSTFQSVTETITKDAETTATQTTSTTVENTTENMVQTTTAEPATEAPTTAPVTTEAVTTEEVTVTVTTPATEAPAETPTEPDTEPATEDVFVEVSGTDISGLPISESDFILLCNVVANEAGSYWIGPYEKAYVAEVVMNRVNSPLYPNTIYGVLTQPYQFSGSGAYVNLGTYSGYVTEAVKEAVILYFTEPDSFTQGYLSFYGDGYRNYFR